MNNLGSNAVTAEAYVQNEGLADTPVAVIATDCAALGIDLTHLETQVETVFSYREHAGAQEYLSLTLFSAEAELNSLLIGPLEPRFIDAFVDAQNKSDEWVLLVRDTTLALLIIIDSMTGCVRQQEHVSVNNFAQWFPVTPRNRVVN